MKRNAAEKSLSTRQERPIFYGLPALLMPKSSSIEQRAERILGMKTNQVIRAVKDCSSSIYRHAVQESGVTYRKSLTKDDAGDAVMAEIFGNASLRRALLEEHAKASFGKGKSPEKIPVIEYALIKDWRPELASLQRGHYGGNAPSIAPNPLLKEGALPADVSATHPFMVKSDKPKGRGLHSISSSPFDAYLYHPSADTPWRSEAGFSPYWLVSIATCLLVSLVRFETYKEEEQAKLAGAAFAISSALGSRLVLLHFLELQPLIGLYLEGLSGLTSDGEPWDGSVWPQLTVTPAQGRMALALAMLEQLGRRLVRDMAVEDLTQMRQVIDECESVLHDAATSVIEASRTELGTLKTRLTEMTESFAITGLSVDFSAAITLVDIWKGLLNDPRMLDKGPEQSRLLEQVSDDIEVLSSDTESLQRRFALVQERYEAINSSKLPWLEHVEQMSALTGELSGFAAECEKLNGRFTDRPCPALVIDQPATEALDRDEHSELRQQVAFHIERSQILEEQNVDLASRLSGVDTENDALRHENAELRLRIEHLQEALNGCGKSIPGDVSHGALLEAVDLVVEDQDAASVLRYLETAYPNRLRVFDSVYDQLHRYPSLPVGQLYQRTKALATVGVDVMRDSGRLIDLRDVVPGDISVQESETVKKSAKLRSLRSFRDGRASREVFTHLNIDYSHRLYFEYDLEEDRMLIAYAGKHLPSAKNATV